VQKALYPLLGPHPEKIFVGFFKFGIVCKKQQVRMMNKPQTAIHELPAAKSHAELAGELAARVTELLHEYDGLPFALVLGALRVVEHELIAEHRR
jgi:hypothetical protein